jgi:hypothetical protein
VDDARTIRGLWLMIGLLALFAGGKAILADTLDPDCFWHLRVAEALQTHGIGPIVDDLSFASIRTPWTPYSWLAELGMKAIWDFGGFRAAVFVQALMMAGWVIFIALGAWEAVSRASCPRPNPHGQDARDTNPLGIVIATAIGMYISIPYLSFRPASFAFLLQAVCAWLILRDLRLGQKSKAIWLLVPTTILLTNCHFFSVLVPLWLGAMMAGAMWNRDRRGWHRYAKLLLMTVLACFCTPMAAGAVRTMWSYQADDPMVRPDGIIAELHPFWTDPIAVALMVGLFGLAIAQRRRISAGQWLWLVGTFILYARMSRLAPAFAPIAAAVLAVVFPALGRRAISKPALHGVIAAVLALGLLRLSFAFPDRHTTLSQWLNRHGPDVPGYPCEAATFVATRVTPSSGRLINEFSWGGYLAWELGDRFKVLLDGRTQLYSPDFWKAAYLDGPSEVRTLLATARADAAVLPAEKSRFHDALIQLGWTSAYRDEQAEVLLPPPQPMIGRAE